MNKIKKFSFRKSCSSILQKNDPSFYKEFLPVYSTVFAVFVLIVIIYYASQGYSLIRGGDSYTQHLKALTYYSTFIREIISTLFTEGRFVIPQWDFEVGMGSDIFNTFSYYSLGDPFNILSFLVPVKFIHIYYQAALILRYYLTGIAFAVMCYHTDNKNTPGVIGGAIAYTFSSFAVYAGLKHAYFINPMVFLPLIILGVEKIIKEKSVLLLMAAVAVTTVSNFYFFYMIVILTVIYVLVRLSDLYADNFKKALKPLLKIAFSSVTGVLMGAYLFLPTVFAFLSDNRSETSSDVDLLYREGYFEKLFLSFFRSGNASAWLSVCVSVIFLPCLITLFSKKKKNTYLKKLYIISLLMMSVPLFGSIMNGFSYVSHRWSFGYVLLICFIITKTWDDFLTAKKTQLTVLCSVTIVVGILAFSLAEIDKQLVLPFTLLAIVMTILVLFNEEIVILLYNKDGKKVSANKKVLDIICIILIAVTAFNYNYYMISHNHGNYISEFKKSSSFNEEAHKSNINILEAAKDDDTFWRYTGRNLTFNSAFISDIKSTQYYWSLSNSNISAFRREMNMAENLLYSYQGFDDRTALNALASVKYFYSSDSSDSSTPYGYEQVTDTVSRNRFAMPLGYTYSEYINRRDFSLLNNSVEKQDLMLSAALLETDTDSLIHTEKKSTANSLEYEITNSDSRIKIKGNSFVVSRAGAQLEFTFKGIPNSETYLCAEKFIYDGSHDNRADFDLISTDKDGNSYTKSFFYYTPDNNFYAERENFDVNLGYSQSGINAFTLTFTCPGTYTFDSIEIVAQSFDGYEEKISALKEDILENTVVDHNKVTGTINLSQKKLLCLSIPFADGWKAYVDGEKAELLKANGMYMGLILDEGEHEIELRYSTPYLKLGFLITFSGIGIFILTAVMSTKKKASGSKEQTEETDI